MPNRDFFETEELNRLAAYAALSARSRGRVHEEVEHPFRTAYQRDRDRIVHCTAFRRLEYKTQVFVNHEGDHYRTRLTHSLEAAQIARTMARFLRVNEDLTEAVTLAHDLGHTPFGHAGEDVMNELMVDHGGFEHNLQALRIVDHLEKRYPGFRGLNLSHEVREGILKHSPRHTEAGPNEFKDALHPVVEAQITDLADEIAYTNHDLEDGITSRILDLDALDDVTLWKESYRQAREEHPGETTKLHVRIAIRIIINGLVTDLLEETSRRIDASKVASVDDVRSRDGRLVSFTSTGETNKTRLKAFLFENMYRHFKVVRMAEKAKRVVRDLFTAYTGGPQQLPPHVARRVQTDGLEHVVCDYIAGMTDRFALDEHKRLFDPHVRL